ncbi:MAG: transcriptional activator RfaH [Rhodobacteraceae bacterium]|nr:transcriptional activator RfaH [Paracoccaceae bacterium]
MKQDIATATGAQWYLAQFKPNAHRIALRNLSRQGFGAFLPLTETTGRSGARFAQRQRPLFPGYLFVSFAPEGGNWRAINSTQGIVRLVAFGGAPAPVPTALVEGLRARCDANGLVRSETMPPPGSMVRLRTGPLADFVARVEGMAPERRVWVLLELMGQPVRVAVETDGLDPV